MAQHYILNSVSHSTKKNGRYILILSYFLAALSGCVNYYGEKSKSTLLTADALSHPQVSASQYHPSSTASGWWQQFHDRQLNEFVTIALSDSPTMQSAEYRLRKAQQVTEEAITTVWPSVDASGYMQRQRFAQYGLVPPPFNGKTFNIGEVGLNFNYELDFWGKNRQLIAASVNEACAAQEDVQAAKLILSSAVITTYFQLQAQMAQLKLAQQLTAEEQAIFNIVQYRTTRDVTSALPVTEAMNNLAASKLTTQQLQAAIKLSINQLAVLMGKNPAVVNLEVKQFAFHRYKAGVPKQLPAHLIAQRPDVRASKLRVEAAAHRINVAKARFFPDVNINALFSYQSIKFHELLNPQSQNNAITGAFDLPIFDAGLRRAQLGENYAEYDIAVSNYNQSILTALREVMDQLVTLKSLTTQLNTQALSTKSAAERYRLMSSQYKHGIVNYEVVLQSKNAWLQQQAANIDLQTKHLQAIVAMHKALGGNNGTQDRT